MSVARAASRFAKNTDTNNNEEGINGYGASDHQVSPAERAARRAKRAERMNVRTDTPDDSTSRVSAQISNMNINGHEQKPSSVSNIKVRTNNWSPQKTSTSSTAGKFGGGGLQFGVDYNKRNATPTEPTRSSAARLQGLTKNKYTPTVQPQTKLSFGNTGRFAGIQKDEAEKPSFGGSASDRMAQFRAAAEKEKAQKAKEEERKKQAAERKIEDEKRKLEEAAKKKEEEEKKKQEEENKASEQQGEDDIPDSEKMKHQPACKKKREKKPARRTMSISNIVLDWVQEMTKDYPVEVKNFSTSWSNGMAFCALIHKFNPDSFDFNELDPENRRYNFDLAFDTGETAKSIPKLLDTNDMVRMKKPEPRSVQTYIQWIWSVYGPTSGYGPTPQEVQSASLS